ncbi:MAG: helix-turn-helix domain-containing protein [Acidobacteria bacterium]|nr:helix-turn-helix domain-containing protein [Acidobacteriota bacterium]
MGKTKVIELTAEQRAALENGYRTGNSHAFRVRCQMVLLKSEQRASAEVGKILGCCEMVVHGWLNRYEAEGIKGLATRTGRGRKPKLSTQNPVHLQTVKAEIAKHPQSVKTVVAKLEEELDMQMHPDTLKRFLKKLVIASAASGRASHQGRWQRKEPRKSHC